MTGDGAPDAAIAAAVEPDGAPRIAVLDMLRGVAILGILFMNINDMGGSITASGGDVRHLGWTPADQIAWLLREVLADGTARCLLEMLFGAGMLILTDRIARGAEGRWAVLRRYGWRNLVLWVFGIAHMFVLMWPGDILHTYAVAAMVACCFRALRPRWLLTIGLVMTALNLFGGGIGILYTQASNAKRPVLERKLAAHQTLTKAETKMLADIRKADANRAKMKAEQQRKITDEDAYGRGSRAQWVRGQWRMNLERLGPMELGAIWEAASVMLIGAALFKLGILQGRRTRRFYLALTAVGWGVGGGLRLATALAVMRFDGQPHIGWATYEGARILMTIGHLGAINLLAGTMLMRPFVAAGRTALTLYVCQTMLVSWLIFSPFGFGLYGQMGWAGMMALSIAVDVVLLIVANVYLRYFRIAPVEWAWRSIVERRRLPFRHRASAVATAALA
ncbi:MULTISPECIES: DUF418 domain-containing protein [unclassified Sphingomonas]|jgi:uncharacterized protein|uniref:DUF418 domain-containing protein n=1 Tax=unclassified Sphingomonas TaxID=196159 RepID=UPI000E10561E|nr:MULTISPECIES: DUF418 domain-containing protein [unclassified Sphingomonas]AXJ96317.1 hypothetical protein DM480_13225 [Sphingomonas sp. FARSPH]